MFNMQFPREVGLPRKIVWNIKEFLDYINLYNGRKKAIYQSVYYFTRYSTNSPVKPEYDSAVVDCLFFDIDDKSCNAYEQCKKLHQDLIKEDIKHKINFSGRGYHLYILTASCDLKYKKEAVRGGQRYFIDKLNLKVDEQVIGNVAQLARIPNTYHPKAGKFCIPLTKEQFEMGDNFISSLASSQNFVKNIAIGNKLFDIKRWDIKEKTEFDGIVEGLQPINLCSQALCIQDLPLCISKCLNNNNLGWKGRYLVISYFRELGYSMKDVYEILKQYLSEIKLYHCVQQERQLQYLFNRNDLVFPSCERIKEDGFCVGKCKFYNHTIYV